MEWYSIAFIVGLLMPFISAFGKIRAGFSEGGLLAGLWTWFRLTLMTLPIAFIIMWIGHIARG